MARVYGFSELLAGLVLGQSILIIIWSFACVLSHKEERNKYKYLIIFAYQLVQFTFVLTATFERTLAFTFWLGCSLFYAYSAIAYVHGDTMLNLLQLGGSVLGTLLVAVLRHIGDEHSTRAAAWAIILFHVGLSAVTLIRLYAELDINGRKIRCSNLHTSPFICATALLGLSIGSGVALFTEVVDPTLAGDYVAYLLAFGMAMINNWILGGISMTIEHIPSDRRTLRGEEFVPISLEDAPFHKPSEPRPTERRLIDRTEDDDDL